MKTLQVGGDHGYGGGGYLLVRWCEHLRSKGWTVDLVSANPVAKTRFAPLGVRIIDDIRIPRMPGVTDALKAVLRLAALIRRERYDIVHTYNVAPGVVGRIAARLAGAVAVHHQAGWCFRLSVPTWKRHAYWAIEYGASVCGTISICVGDGVAEEAKRHRLAPRRRLTVIKNGINALAYDANDERRRRLRAEFGFSDTARVIGTVGRLSIEKDVETLLAAFALLKRSEERRDWKLVVAGDGECMATLRSVASRLQIQTDVVFTGFRDDVADILGGLDVFVTTTRREGLSVAILEAMATGLPIVATDITENRELIQHGRTGLLVPVGNPTLVANAIGALFDRQDLAEACGYEAMMLARRDYQLDRMLSETMTLYNRLASA